MRVNREKLLDDLQMVKAGLSPREFIEQSSCFVFQNKQVMTFNDEVACRKEVDIDITGAIQAAPLLAILEKIDDPELQIQTNESGELEFHGKRKRFGINRDSEIFLPLDRVETPEKWHDLPKEFIEGIGLVQRCVSLDENKFTLCCVHIHPEFIEACDNLQIMRCKVKTGLKKSILVRGTSAAHITSLGVDKIALTRSWLHFKNQSGLVFSCRRYEEDYPVLDALLKIKGHPITIPKGVKEASERAFVFASDRSGEPTVTVTISNGKIRIKGDGLSGWYGEVKSIAYEGPSRKFHINPDLLSYISEHYSEAELTEDKLKASGGSWEYLSVLGSVEEEKAAEETSTEEEEEKPKKKKAKK